MVNKKHLKILKEGVHVWNDWRFHNPEIEPDLSGISLKNLDLAEIDLSKTDIRSVNFINTNLQGANLTDAKIGKHPKYTIFLIISCWFLSAFSGFSFAFGAYICSLIFELYAENQIGGYLAIIWLIIWLILVLFKGFINGFKFALISFLFILGTGGILTIFGFMTYAIAFIFSISGMLMVTVSITITLIGLLGVAFSLMGSILGVIVLTITWTVSFLISGVVAWVFSWSLTVVFAGIFVGGGVFVNQFSLVGLIIFLMSSIYLSLQIILNHNRKTYLMKISQKIADIVNTRFEDKTELKYGID
ncbi:MAG: pentapeptide repeat-containing protein [Crocosphaera sp.]